MSINITELDASPTLRNLSKEEKQAVVRLMEIAIEETIKAKAAELTAIRARIEKLETAASQAVAWLNHYPSPDNIEEQAESNRRRALNILEKALTK